MEHVRIERDASALENEEIWEGTGKWLIQF